MKFTRLLFAMFGSLTIGIFFHELYHIYSLNTVSDVCMQFGGNSIAYVTGTGGSSELVGYLITGVCLLLGTAFGIYDLVRGER